MWWWSMWLITKCYIPLYLSLSLSLSLQSPDVCQYYPIISYRVTVQEQTNQSDNSSDTHLISATNVTSNDSVVTLTVTSLTADQHYLISIFAINEVGTSQSTQEIEICEYLTTDVLYEIYNIYLKYVK